MSPARICSVCDTPLEPGDPRMRVAGQTIHRYCSVEGGSVCPNSDCGWFNCDHSGPCEL